MKTGDMNNGGVIPQHPYTYKKMDPDLAEKRAYSSCKEKRSCSYGVADGTLGLLSDAAGYPFNQIPPVAVQGFKGGVPGHSSICGALVGAALTIGLVANTETQDKLIPDLLRWYKNYSFPQYHPEGEGDVITTVCNSELCGESVRIWCEAAGVLPGSPEMHERCARLCGDVARYTVERLNELTESN